MTESSVVAGIEWDRPGKHFGALWLPRSTNSSAWATLCIPAVSIVNGEGPTTLVVAGVHGDEPEGQVAALNLARETSPSDVSGRLVIIPCLSMEAAKANSRLWPSGANLNRSFPGSPTGSLDQQLADYLTRFLIPQSDLIVDMHSGGRSMICLPWSEMHLVADLAQRCRLLDAMLAWNTDHHFVYVDIAGTGLLVGEAERQGKTVVGTELGGGGHVTAETHQMALAGLRNVLRHAGVLSGEVVTRRSLGLPEPTILTALEAEDYLLAPESGVYETLVELRDRIEVDQPVGRLHFLERPDRPPVPVTASSSGIVCTIRAPALTEQGDCLCVIGQVADRSQLVD